MEELYWIQLHERSRAANLAEMQGESEYRVSMRMLGLAVGALESSKILN